MALNQVTVTLENTAPQSGTNLTSAWVGFHNGLFDTYDRDQAASPGLERLAEDGNNSVISQEFANSGYGDVDGSVGGTPIAPGTTVRQTFNLDTSQGRYFNYASMILPSNDLFIANGNPLIHEIFDAEGNFLGADILVLGSEVLDAGTEVNDEVPANTAFFGQMAPDTGTPEDGTVQLSSGFRPAEDGGILADSSFSNADFTAQDYQVARIRVTNNSSARLFSVLDAGQEVQGGGDATARGSSELILNEFGDALSYSLTISGLDFGQFLDGGAPLTEDTSDDVTRIHLHGGPRGENAGVSFGLIDTLTAANGDHDADDLEITQNADGSVTLQGIWEETDSDALAALSTFTDGIQNAGNGADIPLYWNVHTVGSPGGAIRGQLVNDTAADFSNFNGDDANDLLWVNRNTGALASWSILDVSANESAIARNFLTTDSTLGLDVIDAVDFNADGQSDILVRDNANDVNRILLMDGLEQTGSVTIGANQAVDDPAWRMQGAGNFDSDGEVEILWRNVETGGLAFWDLDGVDATASFVDLSAIGISTGGVLTDLSWEIQATADIDGDNKDEVLWRNTTTGANAIWTLDGSSLVSSVFTTSLEQLEWNIIDAADYNDDGVVDIAWRNATTGQNAIWTMEQNSSGYFRSSSDFIPSLDTADWSQTNQQVGALVA